MYAISSRPTGIGFAQAYQKEEVTHLDNVKVFYLVENAEIILSDCFL